MPRKIFLDGDKNGNRPSPVAVVTIMMIPILVILIMKSRQSKRRASGDAVQNRDTGKEEGRSSDRDKEKRQKREERENKDKGKGTEDKGKPTKKEKKDGKSAPKSDAEKKRDAAKKKKDEAEAKKLSEAKKKLASDQAALRKKTADLDQAKLSLEMEANPDDPVMHPEWFPDEMYDVNNRPLGYSKENRPTKSAMAKRDANGKVIPRAPDKRINLGVDREAPSTDKPRHEYATFRMDQGGFVKHDGPLRHKDQYKFWNQTKQPQSHENLTDRHPKNGAIGDPETQQWFKSKTDQLAAHIGPSAASVFQKAQEIVLAKHGSPLYERAMEENWHNRFGVWPTFAGDSVDAIIAQLEEKHVEMIHYVIKTMQKVGGRKLTEGKDPDQFYQQRLGMPGGKLPDKGLLVHGWFFDSYRLVKASTRMNLMRGPPANGETEGGLGKVFHLLEWLEIFGVLCAKQRLLSHRGFDFAGLCFRLHCQSDAARLDWTLRLTIFTKGGPEAPAIEEMKDGKKVVLRKAEDWDGRLSQGWQSWQGVWSTLFTECASVGFKNEGYQGFATRQLIICPGYTVTGVNAAGGLASSDISRFTAEQTRAISEADLRGMAPLLHVQDAAKGWNPKWVEHMALLLTDMFCEMRPQTLLFWRHRQYNWCKASLTATSNDYNDGDIMMWIELLGKYMLRVKSHDQPRSDPGKPRLLADLNDITNIAHQENQMPLDTIDFGGSIPIVHDKANQTRTFPSLEGHRRLQRVVLPYVPFTRGADNKPALQTDLPATAILVFANALGLRPQLDAKEGLGVVVAVKGNEAQQLERELQEQVILSLKQELGGRKASANTIAAYSAKQTAWLKRIETRGPDLALRPVRTQIDWPAGVQE